MSMNNQIKDRNLLLSRLERLQKKQSELIEELIVCKQAENKKYHLIFDESSVIYHLTDEQRFFLYDLKSHRQLTYGSLEQIKSSCRLRNINFDDILIDANIPKHYLNKLLF